MAKLSEVKESWTESDLTHIWFTKVLRNADPRDNLELKWEKKNQNGRKDLSISLNGRERCIVEFKKPAVSDLRQHLIQAHRYGHSSNYWRDGKLVPILGVLTNGLEAIIFDCSVDFQESARSAQTIHLNNEISQKKFEQIFKRLAGGELGHSLHKHPISDTRDAANDVVENLSKELLKYYNQFKSSKIQDPFDAMLQMFLVSVLRDCGYIPTRTLQIFYDDGNWGKVSELLNEMLAANFKILPKGKHSIIEAVYQETRTLCARLDRVPPDCLGMVYEAVLHKLVGGKATTSYYTPYEIAEQVLEELDSQINETFLDPSCGSGTFLTAVINYVSNLKKENKTPSVLFEYVTKKLRGIDRDIYACQVAKAMVLASVSSQLDFDPSQRELKLPSLKDTIIHDDLFLYEPRSKFDVIAGNLPWGHIDGKRKNNVLDPVTRRKMGPLTEYETYYRNADVCSLALEHLNTLFIKSRGRLGLLIKQQTLHAADSTNFQDYCRREAIKFWDYGHIPLFGNKASLTAIAWINTSQKQFIKKMYPSAESYASDGISLNSLGDFLQGFQSSADSVYYDISAQFPNDSYVRAVYPTMFESKHLTLPKLNRSTAFIPAGTAPPDEFLSRLSDAQKKELRDRAQVAAGYKYSWRGSEGIDLYRFDGSQKRIVFPRNFTNGERMYAMLDNNGKGIGVTSHTIFIPKSDLDQILIYAILGWLNSSHLCEELRRAEVTKLANGGFGVYPNKMESVKIPESLLNKKFGKFVMKLSKSKNPNMQLLDDKIASICRKKQSSKKAA